MVEFVSYDKGDRIAVLAYQLTEQNIRRATREHALMQIPEAARCIHVDYQRVPVPHTDDQFLAPIKVSVSYQLEDKDPNPDSLTLEPAQVYTKKFRIELRRPIILENLYEVCSSNE